MTINEPGTPSAFSVFPNAHEVSQKPAVDEAKIARLKKQIENGEFKVDARAIAAKLVGGHP